MFSNKYIIYAKVYILYIPRCVYRYNIGINGDIIFFSSSTLYLLTIIYKKYDYGSHIQI